MELGKGSFLGLNRFVQLLRHQQIDEDMDCLIGVSGMKGIGKSTFSGQVCRRYVPEYLGKKFNWKTYTAYTIDDVFEKLDNLPEYAPLDADEAVNFALGEDWMRRNMKKLKKIFARVRTKHHIFFFNIPDIWWLDKKYRENMMTMWVHVVKKGHVMLAFPNVAPGIEDRWYRKWLMKKFTKDVINVFTPKEYIMKKLRKYPCYFDEFAFPKLPIPVYKQHIKLREKFMMMKESYAEDFMKKWLVVTAFKYWNENNNGDRMSPATYCEKVLRHPEKKKPLIEQSTLRRYIREVEEAMKLKGLPIRY